MSNDIAIRHVPIDMLTAQSEQSLRDRQAQLETYQAEHQQTLVELQDAIAAEQSLVAFITAELSNVILAQQLQRGDVVRVVCPMCRGEGLRPSDVSGGQLVRGSAFESTGARASVAGVDAVNRCPQCEGQRWVLMERFRG